MCVYTNNFTGVESDATSEYDESMITCTSNYWHRYISVCDEVSHQKYVSTN